MECTNNCFRLQWWFERWPDFLCLSLHNSGGVPVKISILLSLILCGSVSAQTTTTVYNPFTGQPDFVGNVSVTGCSASGGVNEVQAANGSGGCQDTGISANGGIFITGTWHASIIGSLYGGTGQNSSASTGIAHVTSGTWSFGPVNLASADVSGLLAHANIASTAVTPGSYTCTNLTVAADGSLTNAASGSCGGGGGGGSYIGTFTGTTATVLASTHGQGAHPTLVAVWDFTNTEIATPYYCLTAGAAQIACTDATSTGNMVIGPVTSGTYQYQINGGSGGVSGCAGNINSSCTTIVSLPAVSAASLTNVPLPPNCVSIGTTSPYTTTYAPGIPCNSMSMSTSSPTINLPSTVNFSQVELWITWTGSGTTTAASIAWGCSSGATCASLPSSPDVTANNAVTKCILSYNASLGTPAWGAQCQSLTTGPPALNAVECSQGYAGPPTACPVTGSGGTVMESVSPALTGSPTAPTPTACDNSTKLATTAYTGIACNTVQTSGSPFTMTGQSETQWNNTASAYVWDLPVPVSGIQKCVGNYRLRTGAISLVPSSGSTIYYKGVAGTTGSSTGIVSSGAAGDFICVEAVDSTTWEAIGAGQGSWTNN